MLYQPSELTFILNDQNVLRYHTVSNFKEGITNERMLASLIEYCFFDENV